MVEVAESSLAFDREHKASLYARAGVEDYWLVNLIDRVLEVHRVAPPGAVAPLAFPAAEIAVSDLLPRRP